jgi:Ni/Fe-hydrogenase subunit HybB-like protein
MLKADPHDKARLIDPLYSAPGIRFWMAFLALSAIVVWGGVMYVRQLQLGLGVTNMSRPTYWGIYMVNFVFLIGVSMAGTLISAALQLIKAEWRSPITRMAEALTVFGLIVATLQIFYDMGKPERGLNIFQYGRLQSPLLWDAISLTVYLLTSMFALYVQLLPDIALLRDNVPPNAPAWRRILYTWLSIGWRGNREQWLRLEKVITAISIIIIPIGVSLHTVTSWIFSTTVQPGWNSTILGPYFVVGAIFSGIGVLFIVMTLLRQTLHLEEYIGLRQFNNLGWLFIVMCAVWFYFTYTENLSLAAQQQTQEFPVLASKLWGEFAPAFWTMVFLMAGAFWVLVVPKMIPARVVRLPIFQPRFAFASAGAAIVTFVLLVSPLFRPVTSYLAAIDARSFVWALLIIFLTGTGLGSTFWLKNRLITTSVIAGTFVVVAMWLERWLIIIPVVTHPRLMPYSTYIPSLTEIALTAASAALLALMALVFFKLFPAVSIWEVSEGRVIEEAQAKIVIPLPEPAKSSGLRR